ncbi:MAG: methyltransferase domain-containing protein [Anaerolineae bacterium]|nr:methyltransferase domain-containing protein [Anaerolineae bacterium]
MSLPRREQPELLDLGAYDDLDELRQNLDDMARYARLLRLTAALEQLLPKGTAHVLDVGCGSGTLLRELVEGLGARYVGVDRSSAVLRLAQQIQPRSQFVRADGARLPFADASFDSVVCVHTLHHFSPQGAAHLLAECARIARQRVICIDLHRSALGLVGAWVLTRLTSRNRLTRADGVTSVQRAYTLQEAQRLALAAGWANFRTCRAGVAGYALVLDNSGTSAN